MSSLAAQRSERLRPSSTITSSSRIRDCARPLLVPALWLLRPLLGLVPYADRESEVSAEVAQSVEQWSEESRPARSSNSAQWSTTQLDTLDAD